MFGGRSPASIGQRAAPSACRPASRRSSGGRALAAAFLDAHRGMWLRDKVLSKERAAAVEPERERVVLKLRGKGAARRAGRVPSTMPADRLRLLQWLDQADSVGCDARAVAGEAKVFFRGGLDADGGDVCAERVGDAGAHRVDIRCELRPLGDDGRIEVAEPPSMFRQNGGDGFQKLDAVRTEIADVVVGKALPSRRGAIPRRAARPSRVGQDVGDQYQRQSR